VPIIVVSPFAKPHFVSHTNRELTSILKLVETRFGLQPLTARDAAADDMTEFFDFVNPPAFLTPPTLAAQPTNGVDDPAQEAPPQ
jgi:phospholipase C